jgi:hypothetical protein
VNATPSSSTVSSPILSFRVNFGAYCDNGYH